MSTLNPVSSASNGSPDVIRDADAVGKMQNRRIRIGSFDICSKRTAVFALQAIAVGFILASAGAVGVVLWGSYHWALAIAASSCVAGAVASSAISQQVKASDDPSYIGRLRRDASKLNLDHNARKYGWEYIFRWGLLTPAGFDEKYRKQLNGKDVVEIIRYYEKVSESVYNCSHPAHNYRVPHPRESKAQWRIDVKNLSMPAILSKFPLDLLEKYSIVDTGELGKLRELERVHVANVQKRLEGCQRLEAQASHVCEVLRNDFIFACQNAERSLNPSDAEHAKHAARGRYEEGIRVQNHLKGNGLRGIEEAYSSSVRDLDLRYRAYVRMMRN